MKLADEREFVAKVIGRDKRLDLAVLQLQGAHDLPVVALGASEGLRVGEYVVAIGNPFGLGDTVTMGIVSAKSRSIGAGPYDDFIQTDASNQPRQQRRPPLQPARSGRGHQHRHQPQRQGHRLRHPLRRPQGRPPPARDDRTRVSRAPRRGHPAGRRPPREGARPREGKRRSRGRRRGGRAGGQGGHEVGRRDPLGGWRRGVARPGLAAHRGPPRARDDREGDGPARSRAEGSSRSRSTRCTSRRPATGATPTETRTATPLAAPRRAAPRASGSVSRTARTAAPRCGG